MSEPRKRITLHAVHAKAKPASPPYSLVKKALRLFKGRGVPREVYRKNAIKWIAARLRMGDKHVLKGHTVSWGQPGEPGVSQLKSPRRLGERT